jgi:hypothetical protein
MIFIYGFIKAVSSLSNLAKQQNRFLTIEL